ncbi:MAG: heavy metal translocating P-type ATPase, partial [Microbacteriaceae bacterium]
AITVLWEMVKELLAKNFGLDVLALTAIIATLIVGEYWASIVIVLMLTGGEALEDYAANRSKRELNALLDRVPQIAHRLVGSGDETEDIAVENIQIGDRLLVRPAEVIPVDGALLSRFAVVDESSLTGESLPKELGPEDAILSGSVNGSAAFTMRASASSADSQYQTIVRLVREASESKSPMVRLADRYALPFTLFAYAIAALAWWVSGDPVRIAEVLVVATPCPLIIAAPVAFMAGMGRSAKAGIVVKNAGTLELLARAKTVAFDKTGTLSYGEPELVDIRPNTGFQLEELLQLVASAEQYSSHVLASSIIRGAKDRNITLLSAESAEELATNGVHAMLPWQGKIARVVVGKPAFVAEQVGGFDRAVLESGELAVYVGLDGHYAGAIILRDRLRSEAPATLEQLKAQGIQHLMMLTGDVRGTAEVIGRQLGIEDIQAELLPEDKVNLVQAAQPKPVIMVGDGVNDAPVLAAADVGIAMGAKGSTAASESADLVILLDDISRVATAHNIGQRTVRIALESIWIGIILSVALMIVAAFGLMDAVVGAAMQEVVDLVSILNALRALGPGFFEKRRRAQLQKDQLAAKQEAELEPAH